MACPSGACWKGGLSRAPGITGTWTRIRAGGLRAVLADAGLLRTGRAGGGDGAGAGCARQAGLAGASRDLFFDTHASVTQGAA